MTIKEYASLFGVTTDTVRRWERIGKIQPRRTNGGHRRYTEDDVKAIKTKAKYKAANQAKRNVIYCRISLAEHQDELIKQTEGLKMFAIGRGVQAEVITEIGDGTCITRPKFKELVNDILNRDLATIIVTQESRLINTGFELLESIARSCGCEIIAVSNEDFAL